MQSLDLLKNSCLEQLKVTTSRSELAQLKARFLGSDGEVAQIFKNLKSLSVDEKRLLGPQLNLLKSDLESCFTARLEELVTLEEEQQLEKEGLDLSLRERFYAYDFQDKLVKTFRSQHGSYHPVTLVIREVEDIFLNMGFEILDGPHIETDYYNFTALNIPADHPARDMQDTFWFSDAEHLLRTHTSAVQVRGMESHTPPFKFIAPGKVFRCERTDASHDMIFHQIEGMMVAPDISVANLIFFMRELLTTFFSRQVEVRLRPGFFPFVEPGFELDINCMICSGKGCSVCKQTGWLELLPCGMVHPKVLQAGGIDPEKNSGFAFGLGLDRLVMMRYGIDDIRLLHSGDLRFMTQFRAF